MRRSGEFAVVGVYRVGSDAPSLMSCDGRVIVFDTAAVARNVLPALAAGRREHWSADRETVSFSPLDPGGINRAVVLTGYDVYNVPANGGLRSEVRSRAWRRHIHWRHWWQPGGSQHGG